MAISTVGVTAVVASGSDAAAGTNLAGAGSVVLSASAITGGQLANLVDGNTGGTALRASARVAGTEQLLRRQGVAFDLGGAIGGTTANMAVDGTNTTSARANNEAAAEAISRPASVTASDPATSVAAGTDGVVPDAQNPRAAGSVISTTRRMSDRAHRDDVQPEVTSNAGSTVLLTDGSLGTRFQTGTARGAKPYVSFGVDLLGRLTQARLANTSLPVGTQVWLVPVGDDRRSPSEIGDDPSVERVTLDANNADPAGAGATPAANRLPTNMVVSIGDKAYGALLIVAPSPGVSLALGEVYLDRNIEVAPSYTLDLGQLASISKIRAWAQTTSGAVKLQVSATDGPLSSAQFADVGVLGAAGDAIQLGRRVRYVRLIGVAGATLTVQEVQSISDEVGTTAFWRASLPAEARVDRVSVRGTGTVKVTVATGAKSESRELKLQGPASAVSANFGINAGMIEITPSGSSSLSLAEVEATADAAGSHAWIDVDLGAAKSRLDTIVAYLGRGCCEAGTVHALVSDAPIPANVDIRPPAGSNITIVPLNRTGSRFIGTYTGLTRYVRIVHTAQGALVLRELQLWGSTGPGATTTSSTTTTAPGATTTTTAPGVTTTAPGATTTTAPGATTTTAPGATTTTAQGATTTTVPGATTTTTAPGATTTTTAPGVTTTVPGATTTTTAPGATTTTTVPGATTTTTAPGATTTTTVPGATTTTVPGATTTTTTAPADAAARLISRVPDASLGSSAEYAAPSCWAIKQARPTAPTGRYWIRTAQMVEPRPVWCDQVTDGGGWLLIGRGMSDWDFDPAGQGTWTNLDEDPNGTGTKNPIALPDWLVNQMLSNQTVSSLDGGVRLRRAANGAGTAWQEVRWNLDMSAFTWEFPRGFPVRSMTIDGTSTGASGTTRDTLGDDGVFTKLGVAGNGFNDMRRVWTFRYPSEQHKPAFSYGGTVANQSGGWWWSADGRLPQPFTQVWVRPKNTSEVATSVPSSGVPSYQIPFQLRDSADTSSSWGVADFSLAGQPVAYDPQKGPYVLALQPVGGRVFVGGAFLNVQQGPSGAKTAQNFLAAFDRATGAWVSSCRPSIDGRVWAMAALPDGSLLVGGDFTKFDGDTNAAGIAKINPNTCQHDASFTVKITRNGGRGIVRAMDVYGNQVYIGGRFNRVQTNNGDRTTYNLVSMNWGTGALGTWRAGVDGGVIDIDASNQGDRVYVVGTFNSLNGVAGLYYATSMSTGATLTNFTWIRSYGTGLDCCNGRWQQVVQEIGDEVWVGGREHMLSAYDRNTAARKRVNITAQGGDFQAILAYEGKVWGTCHCTDYNLEGRSTYATGTPSAIPLLDGRRKSKINWIGQYSTGRDTFDEFWQPTLGSYTGDGPWALAMDSSECLWAGGDINRRAFSGDATKDWAGHFVKFCQKYDRSVPTKVTGVTGSGSSSGVTVRWNAAGDAGGGQYYVVLRDGIAIARVYGATTYLDATATSGSHQYTVYATDAAGNRGTSSNPITATRP